MTRPIANNIKKCREGANLSQQALADHIHVSRQTISNWERSVSQPDLDSLMLLAEEFHVDVEEIIYGEKPLDVFQATRSKRIKNTILLGLLFLASLLFTNLFTPLLSDKIIIAVLFDATFYPLAYAIGSAFFMSTISIWIDFRIHDRRILDSLIAISALFLCFYTVFVYTTILDVLFGFNIDTILHSYTLYLWLCTHPVIFIFPGAMLFCGFNKNPEPSQPDPQPIQEVDAV